MKRPRVKVFHRPPTAPMGRFGGGWNWKVGVQAGRRSVLLSLLVFEVKVDLHHHRRAAPPG